MILENSCEENSDVDLVRLSLLDKDYFLCLIKRYEKRLLSYIQRISGLRVEDAEDLLQDIFLKTYLNLNDFDSSLKFSSWIYRIAHNQTISNFRKLKSRSEGYVVDLEVDILENFSSHLDLGKEINNKLNKEIIEKILEKIDIKHREVLVLRFLEEKDYKEISDIIKKPMGTVATLINRAKKKFLEILRKEDIKFY